MRFSLLLAGVLLTSTACERTPAPAAAPRLALERCRLPGASAQLRCGTLEVFEDRVARNGRKLKLHVAVAPALSSNPAPDPVFILAGGPGQAASDIAPMMLNALERVRRERDLVFLDQRGTGRSNGLECELGDPEAGLAERLRAEFDEQKVRTCVEELSKKADLRLYTTPVAMDDLDEVRAALGYDRINLWGGSYGTRAALVYMRQHPMRVRTAILDGVAPMQLLLPADVAPDAQRALTLLFEQCAADASCEKTYPGLQVRFTSLLDSLGQAPARTTVPHPVTGRPTEVELGREVFVQVLRALLYAPEATSLVPFSIAQASEGDFRPMIAQAQMIDSGFGKGLSNGMFFSIVCSEDLPFIPEGTLHQRAAGTFLGSGFADDIVRTCALWPKADVPASYREPVRSDLPVLLLSGELDPVTPPRWAEEAKKTLANSAHVVVPGSGHGTLGSACGRDVIRRFLEKGSLEGVDTTCDVKGLRPPFFTSFAGPPP
ncbi:MAG: alpha/beta hydrolase [Myxococcaceae bacterium]